jgi:1-acyl-sn-glycerol-3-phosphate acyltransferase
MGRAIYGCSAGTALTGPASSVTATINGSTRHDRRPPADPAGPGLAARDRPAQRASPIARDPDGGRVARHPHLIGRRSRAKCSVTGSWPPRLIRLPPGPLRGACTFALIVANTVGCCTPLFVVALAKLLVPLGAWRRLASRWLSVIAEVWIAINTAILRATQQTRFEVRGIAGLTREQWYLVISNHRSWVDIFALQAAFNRRIPLLKFFLKQQLRWVPVMGLAWWALDMPFMKRYTRAELERRPELRGTDLATTRRACERFRTIPTSVLNFVEGTRYTAAKQLAAGARYRHLLPPRAGGIAFVIGAMGSMLHELLDVTVAYPQGCGGLWDLCCGRIPEVVVEVARRPLAPWLAAGDYAADAGFRARFQQWLEELWAAKDARLAELLGLRA